MRSKSSSVPAVTRRSEAYRGYHVRGKGVALAVLLFSGVPRAVGPGALRFLWHSPFNGAPVCPPRHAILCVQRILSVRLVFGRGRRSAVNPYWVMVRVLHGQQTHRAFFPGTRSSATWRILASSRSG